MGRHLPGGLSTAPTDVAGLANPLSPLWTKRAVAVFVSVLGRAARFRGLSQNAPVDERTRALALPGSSLRLHGGGAGFDALRALRRSLVERDRRSLVPAARWRPIAASPGQDHRAAA